MMKQNLKTANFEEKVIIPENIEISLGGNRLLLKKGGMESSVFFKGFGVHLNKSFIMIKSPRLTKKQKRVINTFKAHVNNIIRGFDKRYTYKLQICAVHFPMNVTFDKTKREIVIKNFLGERVPRNAKILPGVDVKIEKEILILESHNKENAGQSAANIEASTKITKRDRRIFQDGIWIVSKAGEEI